MKEDAGKVLNDVKSLKPKSIGVRHIQMVLLLFALLLAFSMRVNMSLAIVAMTDANYTNAFHWNMQRQSVILSSFFWGYVVLQIPGGELAAQFGGSILVSVTIACNAAVLLLIPLAAHYGNWQAVCACRVLQGLTQGLLYPAVHNLVGKWIPMEEKGRLGTVIYAGAQLGAALQLLVSGFIVNYLGWPAVFYVSGTLGAIWTVAYVMLGADSPQSSKMISEEEKLYIQNSLGQVGEQRKLKTPWKALWTSLPFYALIVAQSGHSWGLWTLMTEMPSYMKQVLQVDIRANGVMSALPYLSMFLLSIPFGFLSDYALKKKWVSVTVARKISNTVGECGPALALIGLSYVPAGNITLAMVLMTIVVGLNAGQFTGSLIVHIDMAPNFAGTMMGITNFFANIVAIIAPLIAGVILQNESDPKQWRLVFYVSSALYIAASLFFVAFGTSERQAWNEPKETNNGTYRAKHGENCMK